MKRFTLIELLIVVSIIAILGSMLFPSLAQSREQAKNATCISNLRQLGICSQMHADDSGGELMTSYTSNWGNMWVAKLKPYYKQRMMTNCPSDKNDWSYSGYEWGYGYSDFLAKNEGFMFSPGKILSQMDVVSTPQIADGFARLSSAKAQDWTDPRFRHQSSRANVLFLEGSVRAFTKEKLCFSDPYQTNMVYWY